MPSSYLILCRPLFLLSPILPASEFFPMSQLFSWGGQSTGVSALASFLPKNTQDWSPLEWTGWISLQPKRLSGVFSNTTVQKPRLNTSISFLWFLQDMQKLLHILISAVLSLVLLLVFNVKKDHTIHSYLLDIFHLIYVGDYFLTAR